MKHIKQIANKIADNIRGEGETMTDTKTTNNTSAQPKTKVWNQSTWKNKANCHTGNSVLLRHKSGATLEIGGWSRGANSKGKALVNHDVYQYGGGGQSWKNLYRAKNKAGQRAFSNTLKAMRKQEARLPEIDIYIKDYGIPTFGDAAWDYLAQDILALLAKGTDVLITCQGGHGRSGMSASIIIHKLGALAPESFNTTFNIILADPIAFVRRMHCDEAVETLEQEAYVYEILGLDELMNEVIEEMTSAKADPKPGFLLPITTEHKCKDCSDIKLERRADYVCPKCNMTVCMSHYSVIDKKCQYCASGNKGLEEGSDKVRKLVAAEDTSKKNGTLLYRCEACNSWNRTQPRTVTPFCDDCQGDMEPTPEATWQDACDNCDDITTVGWYAKWEAVFCETCAGKFDTLTEGDM